MPTAQVKKIGKATCKARVHFSDTSTETMGDIVKRMLKTRYSRSDAPTAQAGSERQFRVDLICGAGYPAQGSRIQDRSCLFHEDTV